MGIYERQMVVLRCVRAALDSSAATTAEIISKAIAEGAGAQPPASLGEVIARLGDLLGQVAATPEGARTLGLRR